MTVSCLKPETSRKVYVSEIGEEAIRAATTVLPDVRAMGDLIGIMAKVVSDTAEHQLGARVGMLTRRALMRCFRR